MEFKKLKDLCELVNGYTFKSQNYLNEGIRVIRIANVQDGYISDESPCFYPLEYKKRIGKCLLEDNDLLMSLTGNVGRVGIITKDFLPAGLNQRVLCIRTENQVLKEFLYNFFRSNKFKSDAIKNSNGIAQLNLSTTWLSNYCIPIYKETKMKEINKIFKIVDNEIKLLEEQFKLYDELIKSRFIEMFGDIIDTVEIRTLVDTQKISAKKTFKQDDLIKYVDISSIDNKKNIITNYTDYIFSESPSRAQQVLKKNDILISTVRPNLKNVALFKEDGLNFVGSSGFCVLRSIKVNYNYLLYNVLQDEFTNKMISLTTGASYPAIRDDNILSYKIVNAPIELQNEFAEFVQLIDKSKLIVQKQITDLEELLNKKMDEYFN